MKTRYRLIRRGSRGGAFYWVDSKTGKRGSLQTNDEDEARQIIHAKNQAERQPVLNLQIAKAYLAGTDSGVQERTWQHAFEAVLLPITAASVESIQALLRSVRALQAQAALEQAAATNGTSGLSMSDIDAEIANARRTRRRK